MRVERGEVHLVLVEADAAVRRMELEEVLGQLPLVAPQELAALRVEGEDLVLRRAHEHDAVVHDGRRLVALDHARRERPHRDQVGRVRRRHLLERAVSPAVVRPPVHQPVFRLGVDQALIRHRHVTARRLRGLRARRGGHRRRGARLGPDVVQPPARTAGIAAAIRRPPDTRNALVLTIVLLSLGDSPGLKAGSAHEAAAGYHGAVDHLDGQARKPPRRRTAHDATAVLGVELGLVAGASKSLRIWLPERDIASGVGADRRSTRRCRPQSEGASPRRARPRRCERAGPGSGGTRRAPRGSPGSIGKAVTGAPPAGTSAALIGWPAALSAREHEAVARPAAAGSSCRRPGPPLREPGTGTARRGEGPDRQRVPRAAPRGGPLGDPSRLAAPCPE